MSTKPTIKIAFVDGAEYILQYGTAVMDALTEFFKPEIATKDPDIVFYSNTGTTHLRYRECLKIYFTPENTAPDFNECDYAVTSTPVVLGDRHLYLPFYAQPQLGKETPALPPVKEEQAKRPFCTFLYSHAKSGAGSSLRVEFCKRLMETYAHVDCPGAMLHNVDIPELSGRVTPNWQQSKIEVLSRYKFNIAFENTTCAGYITEKLTDAFQADTVPIYWGADGDPAPFPKEAMIYAPDYPDMDALIARIKEVNENDELYLAMLEANPLRHGMQMNREGELRDFLRRIFERAAKGDKPFEKDVWCFGDAERLLAFGTKPWLFPLHVQRIVYAIGYLCLFGKARQHFFRKRRDIERLIKNSKHMRK